MKYVASRLSEGNKIFPAEIHIEENGIKVKIPGFFGGDTRYIDFEHISSVDINTPMIGFSSITFYNHGNRASAHGFKKEEVKQIKEAIDRGKAKAKIKVVNHNHNYENQPQQQIQQPIAERIIEQPVIMQQPINVSHPVAQENTEMYSPQLEKLIAFAMADGELSEKEKQILFKKAEAEGIDLDEFEMVLEAKMHQSKPTVTEKQVVEVAPKSDRFVDIKKCPSCGAIAQSFSTRCSDCGHDFKNLESVNSIKEFFRDYQTLESKVVMRQNNGGLLDKVIGSLGDGDWKKAVFTKKKEFIMHFPIPNSKEDILDFLTMAVPLASPAKKSKFSGIKKFGAHFGDDHAKNYDFLIAEVWIQKCEQLIMKAKFAMKEDKKSLQEVEYYANELGIK